MDMIRNIKNHKIFAGKAKGREQIQIHGHRWENTIKMDLKRMG
jgi:hypothetical protein